MGKIRCIFFYLHLHMCIYFREQYTHRIKAKNLNARIFFCDSLVRAWSTKTRSLGLRKHLKTQYFTVQFNFGSKKQSRFSQSFLLYGLSVRKDKIENCYLGNLQSLVKVGKIGAESTLRYLAFLFFKKIVVLEWLKVVLVTYNS